MTKEGGTLSRHREITPHIGSTPKVQLLNPSTGGLEAIASIFTSNTASNNVPGRRNGGFVLKNNWRVSEGLSSIEGADICEEKCVRERGSGDWREEERKEKGNGLGPGIR